MGYRSQVVLAISKRLRPAFMASLAPNKEATALVFNHHDTLDLDYGGDGSLLVVWDGIKWYDSYDDVTAIQKFVDAADCDDFELSDGDGGSSENFRFVRIGEDSSDVDCNGYGFEHIYPYTSISC